MGRTKTIDDEEILRIARDVFRKGGHAASTRDVADAVGISQGVLFQRFGSKDDLFFRAMTPDPPDLEALMGPYPPRSARADLKRIADRLLEYMVSLMPTLLHVLAHPGLERERMVTWHRGLPFMVLVGSLTDRFKRLRHDGHVGKIDPAASARAFLAAIHSAAMIDLMTGGAHDRGPMLDGLVDVLWSGFSPRKGGDD
jgi:AcrR family transcriptional regulator